MRVMRVTPTPGPGAPFGLSSGQTLDYADEFSVMIDRNDVAEWELVAALFHSAPPWFDRLARLRDQIVRVFGLKTAQNDPRAVLPPYTPGMRLGFFHVLYLMPGEALLGDEDTHLVFRTALRIAPAGSQTRLSVATAVVTKNRFGRIYLAVVKPVHRLIVPIMLRGMARILADRSLPSDFYSRAC